MTDLEQAIHLLGRLYFLIEESECDFHNGVTSPTGLDEGEVRADEFLAEIEQWLADHGDENAQLRVDYKEAAIQGRPYIHDPDDLPF